MTTMDFQNAQVAFYEANSCKFEDVEENKLVYTTIYCEFLQVMEVQIEQ